jgi:formiminotetrahydrofolate cyclodeaminase
MSIWDKNLKVFKDELGSASPTPGGGSAAAISGVIGTSLFIMALEVSAKRPDVSPALSGFLPELKRLREELAAIADEDVAAYQGYTAARSMEKNAARDEAMAAALERSFEVPFRAASLMLQILKTGKEMAPSISKTIMSDLVAGTSILTGAFHAALATADANIPYFKDEAKKAAAVSKLEKIFGEKI